MYSYQFKTDLSKMFTKTNALDCENNTKQIEPYDAIQFLIVTSDVTFTHNRASNG